MPCSRKIKKTLWSRRPKQNDRALPVIRRNEKKFKDVLLEADTIAFVVWLISLSTVHMFGRYGVSTLSVVDDFRPRVEDGAPRQEIPSYPLN
jgi:hypothetical protein